LPQPGRHARRRRAQAGFLRFTDRVRNLRHAGYGTTIRYVPSTDGAPAATAFALSEACRNIVEPTQIWVGDIQFIASFVSWLERYPVVCHRFGTPCPPLPAIEMAEDFTPLHQNRR